MGAVSVNRNNQERPFAGTPPFSVAVLFGLVLGRVGSRVLDRRSLVLAFVFNRRGLVLAFVLHGLGLVFGLVHDVCRFIVGGSGDVLRLILGVGLNLSRAIVRGRFLVARRERHD